MDRLGGVVFLENSNRVVTFHGEVLGERQRQVLQALCPSVSRRGFYLGGGTAVALHLGHRRSVDFDWFLDDDLGDPMALAGELRNEEIPLRMQSVGRGTLHALVSEVRVSFLEYRYPLLEPPVAWEERGCDVASLDDLACMKLAAVAQRGTRKDFVDIHALLRRHRPLPELLDLYRRKYDAEDVGHLLFGLSYFDDAEAEVMPTMLEDVAWDEVKEWVAGAVRDLA